MADKNTVTIEKFQEFSSFRSCIKYYGRSILPPVSLLPSEELQQLREKAISIENQIALQKDRLKLAKEAQDVYNRIEEHLNSMSVPAEIHEVSNSKNTTPDKVPSHDEELSNPRQLSIECRKDLDQDSESDCSDTCNQQSRPNSAFKNLLLDNAESFCSDMESFISPSCTVLPFITDGEHVVAGNQSNVQLVSYAESSSSSCAGSETSEDEKETEEADCQSLATVIVNTYEALGCDIDSSSVISVARSSDLEKYLDCSLDSGHLSNNSTVVGDSTDIDRALTVYGSHSPKTASNDGDDDDPTPVAVPLDEEDDDEGGRTYVIDPRGIEKSFTAEKEPSKICLCTNNRDEKGTLCKFTKSDGKIKNANYKFCSGSSESSQLFAGTAESIAKVESSPVGSKIHEPDVSVTNSHSCIESKSSRKRHVRRNSYTLEHPSPALVSSHADCKCGMCPGIPHSTSLELSTLSKLSSSSVNDDNQHCANQNISGKPSVHTEQKAKVPFSECGKHPSMKTDAFQNYEPDLLSQHGRKLSETKEVKLSGKEHKRAKSDEVRKLKMLLNDHDEKWMKLSSEYEEQRRRFVKQLECLSCSDDELTTAQNFINDAPSLEKEPNARVNEVKHNTPTKAVVPCSHMSADGFVPSTSHKIFKHSGSSPSVKSGSIHKALSPASSKGNKTPSSKPSTSVAVPLKSKHCLARSKSFDGTPLKSFGALFTTKVQSSSSVAQNVPKDYKPLIVRGVQQKLVAAKPSLAKHYANRFGPLKTLTPLSIARTFASLEEKHMNTKNDGDRVVSVLKAINDPEMQKKFEKVSAAAKGYLTRRLLQTEQLQQIIKTAQDSANLLLKFYDEAPLRKESGMSPSAEEEFRKRLVRQMNKACKQLYYIVFDADAKERMEIIAKSREAAKERMKQAAVNAEAILQNPEQLQKLAADARKPKISSATLKSLERKRLRSLSGSRCASADVYPRRSVTDITHGAKGADQHRQNNERSIKSTSPYSNPLSRTRTIRRSFH